MSHKGKIAVTSLISSPLRQGALELILLMGAVSAAAAGPADHPRGVVDELAFSQRQFPEEGAMAVSANGAHLAFAVRTPPADINRDGYYTAGGLPATVVGTRIYVRSLKNRDAARQICAPAGQQWFPAWSPDGRRLAFYSDAGGTPQLWLYDRSGDKCRPIATPRIRMTPFVASGPYWGADNRTVYVPLMPKFAPRAPSENTRSGMTDGAPQVSIHRSGREIEKKEKEKIDKTGQRRNQTLQEHNVAFAAVDVDSGAHRIVVPADSTPRPMAMRLSASGRWLGYLSVFRRSADLASSKLETALAVVPASGGQVIPLADGLPNVQDIHDQNYSWHPQKDQLVYVKNGELWYVVLGSGGRVKKRRLDAGPDAISPRVHWFTRDGTAVVVQPLSIADEAPVLRVTPLDGSPSRPVILDRSHWQFQGLVRTNASTLWQPDGQALIIRARNVRTAEQAILSLTPGEKSPRVLWQGKGRISHMTGGGHHDFILAAYEDYATPPDLYRFSGDFSRKERLSAIDPRLNDLPSGKVHYFDSRVPMPGGRVVKVTSAVLMPPRPGPRKGDKDAPPPAVAIIYPQSDLTWYASQYGGGFPATVPARALTGRGYAVVLTHVPMPPPGQAVNSLKIITDALLPQIYRAAELGYVDLGRLALMGQSYGAYSTAGVLTRTNLFKAAVAISGLYDPAGAYGRFLNGMMFGATYYEDGQGRMGASPWEDPRRYLENSPYGLADRIRTPLLLLQGAEDHLPEESEKMFNALHRLGRTAQLAFYDGEGHVIENWRRQNALDATRRIIRFLQKYLDAP